MIEQKNQTSEEKARDLLSRLSAYAKEHGFADRKLAEEMGVPYDTLRKWWFFSQSKDANMPSERYVERIGEFLESKESPELYKRVLEARHRAGKIKLILLLLEDELRWFRDDNSRMRDEFRKELDAFDIGYISSLLTMLTEEEKFQRWLALTTTCFNSFKGK